MLISISPKNDVTNFKTVDVGSLQELARLTSKYNWSCGIFKDEYRNKENFIEASSIALDIDGGLPIDEAKVFFKEYKHLIMPSRSHQKEKVTKSGKVIPKADRFRVVLFLDEVIKSEKDFTSTWYGLKELCPQIDDACKDASRFYYPSGALFSSNIKGKTIKTVKWTQPDHKFDKIQVQNRNGQLSARTLDFLLTGANLGSRHDALYKAAKDAHEQGVSNIDFIGMVNEMNKRIKLWSGKELSEKNTNTVNDAYKEAPRYDERKKEKPVFNFKTLDKLSNKKVEWVVDGLLSKGGFSIIAGAPKSGKSTLTRQLSKCVLKEERFLNRKVVKGKVLYLSMEEQEEVLREQFRTLKVSSRDGILLHTGSLGKANPYEELEGVIKDYEPILVVVDTLLLFCKVASANDYNEVNLAMEGLRNAARNTGAHVICLHHQNKGRDNFGASSILGSTAFHGAVDNALIFDRDGMRRYLTTDQRYGRGFSKTEVIYDEKTALYTVGKPKKERNEEF